LTTLATAASSSSNHDRRQLTSISRAVCAVGVGKSASLPALSAPGVIIRRNAPSQHAGSMSVGAVTNDVSIRACMSAAAETGGRIMAVVLRPQPAGYSSDRRDVGYMPMPAPPDQTGLADGSCCVRPSVRYCAFSSPKYICLRLRCSSVCSFAARGGRR